MTIKRAHEKDDICLVLFLHIYPVLLSSNYVSAVANKSNPSGKICPSPWELLEEAKIKLLSSGKEHSFKDQYGSLVARQTEIIKELC